jgi:hypothetical protein
MNLKAVWHDLEYRAYSDSGSIIQRGLGHVPAADDVRAFRGEHSNSSPRGALVPEVATGSPIVTEGVLDDGYHMLLTGRATVTVAAERRRVLLPGNGFGETAVLHGVPRTATVIADQPSRLLTVSGDA